MRVLIRADGMTNMTGHKLADSIARLCTGRPTSWPVGSEAEAVQVLEQARWPDGPSCPSCGGDTEGMRVLDKRLSRWTCTRCDSLTSIRLGTCMQESRTPLDAWVFALRVFGQSKSGPDVVAALIATVGVAPKTAKAIEERILFGYTPKVASGKKPTRTQPTEEDRQAKREEIRVREELAAIQRAERAKKITAKRKAQDAELAEKVRQETEEVAEARADELEGRMHEEVLAASQAAEDAAKEAIRGMEAQYQEEVRQVREEASEARARAKKSRRRIAAGVVVLSVIAIGNHFQGREVQAAPTMDDIPFVHMGVVEIDGKLHYQTSIDTDTRYTTEIGPDGPSEAALLEHAVQVDQYRALLLKNKLNVRNSTRRPTDH